MRDAEAFLAELRRNAAAERERRAARRAAELQALLRVATDHDERREVMARLDDLAHGREAGFSRTKSEWDEFVLQCERDAMQRAFGFKV